MAREPLLMLCYEYPPVGGGGAKVVASLCADLSRLGQPVELITMGYQRLPADSVDGALRIFRVPGWRRSPEICHEHEMLPYLFTAFNKLFWRLRRQRYRLNHTHFIFPDGVIAWLARQLFGLPYIITAHGSDVPGYNPERFAAEHRFLAPIWRRITQDAEAIVCPSHHLERLVLASNPTARTQVIPNGIDIARFRADQPRDGSILVISRMFERKGVQFLLRALAGMADYPTVNIVGDGPYLETLRQLAAELGVRVNFLGFIDNTSDQFRELLEAARYFVFTSSSENFPVVLLEAMTAGLSIITSNDTGCIEVVEDCALTIPPQREDVLREALQTLLNDPQLAESLGRRARERVERLYCSDAVARRHLALYEEVASRHGR